MKLHIEIDTAGTSGASRDRGREMDSSMMTAAEAIEESRFGNRIVTLDWTAEREIDLIAEADDSARTEEEDEYWGRGWRVHLTRTEGRR